MSSGHQRQLPRGHARLTPEEFERVRLAAIDMRVVADRTHFLLSTLPGVSYCAVRHQIGINRYFGAVGDGEGVVERAWMDLLLCGLLGTVPGDVAHPLRDDIWCDTLSWVWGFPAPELRIWVWRQEQPLLRVCENAFWVCRRLLAHRDRAIDAARRWACVAANGRFVRRVDVATEAEAVRVRHAYEAAEDLLRFENAWGFFLEYWRFLAPLLRVSTHDEVGREWPGIYAAARASLLDFTTELARHIYEGSYNDYWECLMEQMETPDRLAAMLDNPNSSLASIMNHVGSSWSYVPWTVTSMGYDIGPLSIQGFLI